MINIYTSNRLENLAKKFSANRKADTAVFGESIIVTETEGMGWWLAIETARNNGIAANFDFVTGTDFIRRIFTMAGLRSDRAYTKQNMKWQLFSLLNEDEFKRKFPLVSNYYEEDNVKRFQLAVEVAGLFDKYMVYRTDYIEAWNSAVHAQLTDDNEGFSKHEAWQYDLWQALKREAGDQTTDRVVLKKALLEKLATPKFQKRVKEAFTQVSFFGLSLISDYFTDIYNELGKIIDIHFYICNASPNTSWFSRLDSFEVLDNELFDNFNALGKESLGLLNQFDPEITHWDHSLAQEPATETLLGKIKNDIYQNNPQFRNLITDTDLADETIAVSSSYTPARELEALYNYLLHMFEKDKQLMPHDVVIQLTDIEQYTPYIQAIFDNAATSIPYTIVDRSYKGDDTIVGILDLLLTISEDDFTSEVVLQLLDSHFIRQRFGITDVDFLRQLVRDANIRLSIDGRSDDDSRFVSWHYGLQRMLLGYAIKGGEEYQSYSDSLYPLDTFEDQKGLEMLRFKAFVDCLISSLKKRKGTKSLQEWNQFVLNDIIGSLIAYDDDSSEEFQYIVSQLEGMADIDDLVNEQLTYQVFCNSFQSNLFSESRKNHFVNGRVTFCSMIPLRSVPFKLVAMVGLDADKFPRTTSHKGFDLISFEKRKGDVNAKINDRYLFLENILSARQYLYISYLGNNVKNCGEQPASLLVDELMSYIEAGNNQAHSVLFTAHPMQLFSRVYYRNDHRYYSYLNSWDDLEEQKRELPETVSDDVDLNVVRINNLIRFCKDPVKFYYNKTLRIDYDEEEVLLPETEVFELDNLQRFQTNMAMVSIKDDELEQYVEHGKKTGYLPLATMSDIAIKKSLIDVDGIRQQIDSLINTRSCQSLNLELAVENDIVRTIQGDIDNIYGDAHLCVNVSGESAKYRFMIDAWIKHLLLMANGEKIDTLFVAKYTTEPIVFPYNMLTQLEAKKKLSELVEIYCEGHDQIIFFLPAPGFFLFSKKHSRSPYDIERALKEIRDAGMVGDWPNKYIAKEIESGDMLKDKISARQKELLEQLSDLLYSDIHSQGIVTK